MVIVSINLARVRRNAEAIRQQTGVPIIAVVKADAYGLGASEVAGAIGDLVEAFYVFDTSEAVRARLFDITGKRTISLNSAWKDPEEFKRWNIQPVVWSIDRARELHSTRPVLSIDTGQQRFSCPPFQASVVLEAGGCQEVMTHATILQQVDLMLEIVSQWSDRKLLVHAAGSALLDQPRAWLGAVRPGLALYQGAMKVTTPLVDVRDSTGPAGYTGFLAPRFGIILAGYASGLRRGPCLINGQLRQVIEVGMQSAFVEAAPSDKAGDEVILLENEPRDEAGSHESGGADLKSVATVWGSSQQEVLVRFGAMGKRVYL